jgi:serine phosphatase RsbU (regulator of sigma subunit)
MPDEFLHMEKDPLRENRYWGGMYSEGVLQIEFDPKTKILTYSHFNPVIGDVESYILPFAVQNRMIFAPKSEGVYAFNEAINEFELDAMTSDFVGQDFSCWLIKEDVSGNIFYEASGPVFLLKKEKDHYKLDTVSLANLNIGYVNDIFCSEFGYTWLAAEENIVKFNPNNVKDWDLQYKTIITGMTINSDSSIINGYATNLSYYERNSLIFNFTENNISFQFVSPQFAAEKDILYSYILKGNDNNYSKWSTDRKAIYTNLDAGSYVFEVKSINQYGIESNVVSISFEILPPWYKTTWAIVIFIVAGVLFVWMLIKLNSYRLKAANMKLQELIEEKTKVISENLKELSVQKNELEEKNNDIIGSINYAKRLQTAILPSFEYMSSKLKEHFVLYVPKDIVAGDFYWMEEVDGKVLFAAADCTGHGVPGALVSVVCNDALKRAINEFKLEEPNLILDKVNDLVKDTFNSSFESEGQALVRDGMDISLCHYDNATRKIKFAGANNPIWIMSKNDYNHLGEYFASSGDYKLYQIAADRQPIGSYMVRKHFTCKEVQLQVNDKVYLFTDGIIDQFGGENFGKMKKFKKINLSKLLFDICELPMAEQQSRIESAFHLWKGSQEQIDDVTIMGINIH